MDGDEVVAVGPSVLVMEAEGMEQLVHNRARLNTKTGTNRHDYVLVVAVAHS